MADLLLEGNNVPSMFRSTLYDDFKVEDAESIRILERVESWADTGKPALLLQGDPGLGKTMLGAATLNEFQKNLRFRSQSGREAHPDVLKVLRQQRLPVYFIQLAELIAMHLRCFKLHDLLMRDVLDDPIEYLELDQLLQDLKNKVEVLVIDDVGKEHRTSSGFAEDAFDLLVRTRHNEGLRTIYTTNVPLYRWSSQYSESMRSLIKRSARIVDFE